MMRVPERTASVIREIGLIHPSQRVRVGEFLQGGTEESSRGDFAVDTPLHQECGEGNRQPQRVSQGQGASRIGGALDNPPKRRRRTISHPDRPRNRE